jgi:uncharacterized membrane protein YccC
LASWDIFFFKDQAMSDSSAGATPPAIPKVKNLVRTGMYYALRTGAAAGVATAIWHYLHLERGWWIAVSAVVVLQPDPTATMAKSANRILGTLIGAATATLAATFLPLNPLTAAVVVALTVGLAWSVPNLREPLPLTAVTAVLVFTLDNQQESIVIGLWRALEIFAGVAIGLAIAAIRLPGEGH